MKKLASDIKIEENVLKNALFTAIIHSTENAIVSKTLDGIVISWNPGAEKLFGYTADEMIGKSITKIIPDDLPNEESEILKKIRVDETIGQFQTKRKNKTGEILDISITIFPLKDDEGRIIGASKIAQDITGHKKKEEQQKFLLKLSDVLRPLSDPAKIQECAARLLGEHLKVTRCYYTEVEANNQYCVVLQGYYKDVPGMDGRFDMVNRGKIWLDALRAGQTTLSEDVKNESGITQEEVEAVLNLQIASHITVPLLKNGRLTAMFSITDIKPRKWSDSDIELLKETADRTWSAVERARAEEALQKSEESFRVITKAALAFAWICSAPDGSNIFFNEQWYEYTGQTQDEAAGYGWANATHPDDWISIAPYWQRCQKTGEVYEGEVRYRRHDGEYRWFAFRALPRKNSEGKIEAWYGLSFDIHEKKKAEEALQQSEEKYRTLFDSIDEGVSTCEVIIDENQHVVDFRYLDNNWAFTRLNGLPNDIIGRRYLEFFPALTPYLSHLFERVLKTGVPERHECAANGSENNWLSCYTTRLGGEDSQKIIMVYSNITERKNIELRQAFLLKLSDAMRNLTSSLDIQETACRMLGKRLGTTRTLYTKFIIKDEVEYIQILGQYTTEEPFPSAPILAENYKATIKNYDEGNITLINDVEAELPEEAHSSHLQYNIRSAIGVPLLKKGKPILVFEVHDNKPRQWTVNEIELVKETARRTWEAVERAKAEEALRINEERMRVQKEAIQSVIKNASLATSLRILSELVINETAGEARTGFYIGNKENTELTAIRGSGNMPDSYADQVDGFFIGPESLACGLAAATGLPVLTTDVKEDPLWEPWLYLAEQYNYRSCWSFPIQTGNNKPMGTFAFYFKDPREATAKDLALADIIMQTAAVIISSHIETQQRAEAEAALRKSEEQLRHIKDQLELSINAGEIGIWNFDIKNNRLHWSKQQYELYGITEDEFEHTPEAFWEFVNPVDRERLQKEEEKDFKFPKSDITQQFRITRKDGMERWIENRMKTEYDAEGNPESVIGVNIDITGEKLCTLELEDKVQKRTAEISRQKDFIETIINSTPNLVGAFDTDCRVITFNKAYQDLFKIKEEDVVGKIYTDVFPTIKGGQGEKDLQRALNGEIIHNAIYHSPMTGRYFENYLSPVRDESGKIYAAVVIAHDITESIHAVEKIKQSEEKFSKLFENSPFSISLTESDTGRIIDVNDNYIELTGYTREEIIGRTSVELNLIEKESRDKIFEQLIKHNKIKNIEVEIKVKSGISVPILISSEKINIGQKHYFLHAFNNITERKKSEKEIEQKNKELEKVNKELEAFTYISSHDLQEPLRKIRTFATHLLEKEEQNLSDTGKEYFHRMQNAASRMQDLIQDLLAFSRLNTYERKFEVINFSNILDDVKSEFNESITEKNAIIRTEELCDIKIIPFQFRQLIHNLISNSLKFSKPGIPPHITINCKKTTDCNPLNGQSAYHITYSDNGIGFEQHFSEQVFQLFQRLHSREEYPGTGIGLAIVKKVVENHKGIITVTSELDKGAKFDIHIPV